MAILDGAYIKAISRPRSLITFSATPTIVPTTDFLAIYQTANITSWSITGGFEGQLITIDFAQDGGPFTVAGKAANIFLVGGAFVPISPGHNIITFQYHLYGILPTNTPPLWIEVSRALGVIA